MRHILICSPYHISNYTGGQEAYMHQLATYLANSGFQISYLTGSSKPKKTKYKLITIPTKNILKQPIPTKSWRHTIKTINPSLVHIGSFNLGFTMLAHNIRTKLNIPTICMVMAKPNHPSSFLRTLSQLSVQTLPLAYDGISVLTDSYAITLRRKFKSLPIAAIQPALTHEYASHYIPKTQQNNKTKYLNLLFVGSLDKHHYYKGLPILLKSLNDITRPIHLTIVGSGDLVIKYTNMAKKLSLASKTTFTGYISTTKLKNLYHQADVTIIPSTSTSEGFSLTALESLSQGTPIITTTVTGISHQLSSMPFATITEPSHPYLLAHAINQIKKKLQPNTKAIEFARSFTSKKMVKNACRIYNQVLSNAK